MHPALGPQLPHPGVDDRVAGASLAPRRRTGPGRSVSQLHRRERRVEALAGPTAARATARPRRTPARPAPCGTSPRPPGRPDRSASSVRGCTVPYFRWTDSRLVPGQVRPVALVGVRRPAPSRGTPPTGRSAAASPAVGQPQRRPAGRGSVGTPVESTPVSQRTAGRAEPAGAAPAVRAARPGRTACTPGTACRRPCAPGPARPRTASRSGPAPPRPAARPSTRSSRSRPYGPKSAATCTEPPRPPGRRRGTTFSGLPRSTTSRPPSASSSARRQR